MKTVTIKFKIGKKAHKLVVRAHRSGWWGHDLEQTYERLFLRSLQQLAKEDVK